MSLDLSARTAIEEAIRAKKDLAGALLPVLHAVQDALGYIPDAGVPLIAEALNLSRAEVHGVISFYHDFRSSPPGRHVLKLCRAEACQAMGSQRIEAHLERKLGVGMHATTADGAVTLEPVYCLGNCALSPSLQCDGQLHGRMDEQRVDALLAELRSGGRR